VEGKLRGRSRELNIREGWGPPGRASTAFVALLASLLAALLLQVCLSDQARALEDIPDSGTWHVSGGEVHTSVVSEDGETLYIGGNFDKVWEQAPGTGGASFAANGLAAIDIDSGQAIRAWNPQVSGGEAFVYSIDKRGDSVFVGGNFSAVNGQPRRNLAELDADNGSLRPFSPQVGDTSSSVRALKAGDGKLYIGGVFGNVNGESQGNLAAFDLSTRSLDNEWTPRTDGVVQAFELAADGQTLFAAGGFYNVKSSNDGDFVPRRTVARFSLDSGDIQPWYIPERFLSPESPQTSWALEATQNRLYVGSGDKGPNYVQSFRLDSGNEASREWRFGTVGDPQALALAKDGSRLFVGGHFGTVRLTQNTCGTEVHGLISLNPQNGKPFCDWIPILELFNKDQWNGDAVWTLQATDDYVWVGGRFYTVSDVEQRSLARFTLVPRPEPVPPPEPVSELRVNFQTADAPVPAGYIEDFGEPFGSRQREDQGTGLYYGWVEPGTNNPLSLTEDGRFRASLSDNPRLASLMHMQKSAQGAWEMSIPNGTYEVTVSVGDNDYTDSTHNVNVEGQSLIDSVTLTNDDKFESATETVEVTDQRLTVDAAGGQNTKINYIDITNADANLSASQQNLDFGNTGIGGNPKTRNLALENTSSSQIDVQDIQITGPDADVFSLESLSGDTTLAPGESLTVEVGFRPERTGSKEATLTVTHSGDNPAIEVGLLGQAVPNGQGCTIIGTGGADEIQGTEGDDVICAYGGNDTVRGLGGDDEIRGQSGADRLYGNDGNDRLYGGPGPDELYGGPGDDLLDGGPGNDLLDGGTGNNTLRQ